MTEQTKKRLRKLRLGEVSLVTRGADDNALISIFKSKHGKETTMTDAEKIAAQMAAATATIADLQEQVTKANAATATAQAEASAAIRKAMLSEATKGGDEDAILKAADPIVAQEIIKLRAANAASARQLAEIADGEQVRKFVDQSKKDHANLPVSAEEIGPVLKRATALLPAEDMTTLLRILKAADATTGEAMRASGLPQHLVRKGSAEAEIERMATERAKSENISFAKAYDDVLTTQPSLYRRYMEERGAAN